MTSAYFDFSGTASSSASQASGLPSDGARQSPRGDSEPPDEIFGPLGSAERLNWLTKTGQPYVGKVQRLFKDLEKEKLVRRYRKRFVLTAAGKKAKDEG